MKRHLLTFALCLLGLFATTMSVSAETVASGTCGTNLTWLLDDEGLLTISGTGAMTNYTYNTSTSPYSATSPWKDYVAYITSVVIESGATSIGNYAFFVCSSLTSVSIPNSVTSIRTGAFESSAIESITIPDGVTTINGQAFRDCHNLSSITIK